LRLRRVAAAERGRVKREGGAQLAGTLRQMLAGKDLPAEARKVAEREVNYFQKHKGHMDYDKRRKRMRPTMSVGLR